jgi:tetratricopeptide (TPR) repeat protein
LKGKIKITLFFLVVILLAACSRKKNTFLSRNAHAVKAEFNALYNGNLAFEDGKQELSLTYRDNFWEILPLERIDLEDDMMLPGADGNPLFNRAEEKAAKAIQTHSIYLDGKEYNPQIDEAYILLGKARYFDRRFIPALDAFNFILDKYPTSNNINHAKVWRAKTNIRLNNEEVALESLTRMLKNAKLSDEDYTDANAIMAQAFISLDSIDAALPYIKEASVTVKDYELKGRYTYIKGQLYNRLGHKDSANMAFDEVIEMNRKSPRVYMINAYIAQAKNFDYEEGDKTAFLDLLFNLESDRENRPYLDKIYNQIGEYYRNNDSIETAIEYYNKSIEYFQNDNILQSVNYQTLAEIDFDRAEYRKAGLYYDSTLTHLAEGSKQWRRIKKKRENLDDVIKYEDIAATNDSILRIVAMTESQRLAYFTEYTTKLKEKAIADSIASVKEQEIIANNEFYKKTRKEKNSNEGGGTFYFYNSSTVSFGKQEFKAIWGNRKLEDDWRRSSKVSKMDITEDENTIKESIAENELFNPDSYIAKIPTDQKKIESLFKDRNFAYYQLGLIYKEKFREYGLAADRLTKLLSYNPEQRLILPSKYNLHKIYLQLENNELAEFYKNDIINNYPDSRYAEILLNPNTMLATDESSPEFKYKELFREFEASNYQFVIDQCDAYIKAYFGDDVVPKFELLKATAIARQQGFEPYKKALNFIALNYPNSDEGKQAQKIYSTVLPTIANKNFYADEQSDEWKLIYDYKKEDREEAVKLKEKLDDAIEFFNYNDMLTSIDYYNPKLVFVVIHGLNTRLGGRGFGKVLEEHKEYKVKKSFFEINSPNYKIIQIHKNLDEYLTADLSIPLIEDKKSGVKTDAKKEKAKEDTNAKKSTNERRKSKREIINEKKEKSKKNRNEKGNKKEKENQKS